MDIPKSAYYAIARVVSAFIGVAAVPLYTSLLRPEEYGESAIAFSVAFVVNALLFHWISASTARLYPTQLSNIPGFLGVVFGVWVKSAGLLVLGATVFLFLGGAGRIDIVMSCIVLLISTSLYELSLEISRSGLRAGVYAAAAIVYAICSIAAGGLMAYSGMGVVSPLLGTTIGQFAAFFVVSRFDLLRPAIHDKDIDASRVRTQMLSYGGPMAVALVISMSLPAADRYLIGHLLGLKEVAVYAATYALAFPAVVMLASVVNLTGYPRIMRAHEAGNDPHVEDLLREQITILLALLLPMVAGVFLVQDQLKLIVPAGPYASGVAILPYIMLAAILNAIRSTYVDLGLHITRKVSWIVSALFFALITIVLVNWIVLPVMGVRGAVVALCLAYVVALLVSLIGVLTHHPLPFPSRRDSLAIVGGLSLMVCVTINFHSISTWGGLALRVAAGGAAYVAGALLMVTALRRWAAWRVAG